MSTAKVKAKLREIPVDKIDRNPENPRLFVRTPELETLLNSIRRRGVQVPISVYEARGRYVLVDGERRWRCCLKLNRKTIPALVQEKPDALQNLLLMFNIHALREQWDLLTIALKLPRVVRLLEERNSRRPTEAELADETGLPRAAIRRGRLLMDMPDEYREQLMVELQKPKSQQQLSEDFFIEMERSLKTVERVLPEALQDKNVARDVLIDKYKAKIIPNVVHLRMIPKVARASRVSEDTAEAVAALKKLFKPNRYSAQKAYDDSVAIAYSERDLLSRIEDVIERVEALEARSLNADFRQSLRGLLERLIALVGNLA
jgi:ParB family transcriptional regulator, chromosome partitioning protein